MTNLPHISKSVLAELTTIERREYRLQLREEFIEAQEISLHNGIQEAVIGHLSDLPQWTQAYIKQLRADLFDKANPNA